LTVAEANRTELSAGQPAVLEISDLNVWFDTNYGKVAAVRGASLSVASGEVLALVGESGSGKTVTSRTVLGLHPSNATVAGSVKLGGKELVGLSETAFNKIRGSKVAMVFQEPSRTLNPVFTIGSQLIDTLVTHLGLTRADAKKRAIELLDMVGIPDAAERIGYYPHQLSGGQKQRVVIATAISCNPELIIADEPTTALDVTIQAEILDLLRELRDRLNTAILLITHNMGVVADLADRVAVMHDGRVVETGGVYEVFGSPKDEYTRKLLAAVPKLRLTGPVGADPQPSSGTVLEVSDLTVRFSRGLGRPGFLAVNGVSFSLDKAETLAIVGESGSGKTTIARTVAGLQRPSSGTVLLQGSDVARADAHQLRKLRSQVGYVFQDPNWSLNPHHKVAQSIAAPLSLDKTIAPEDVSSRIDALLDAVRLPREVRHKYPHELSGGQAQRASIARALIRRPLLLIADEPTSALDVSVQAQVLDLLTELQAELGFACLFITHDLAVVSEFADSVVVMSKGALVESGPAAAVLSSPGQEYTKKLVAAVPIADPELQRSRQSHHDQDLTSSRRETK
jgi:peptide/nickel transport system ATP-binding protein